MTNLNTIMTVPQDPQDPQSETGTQYEITRYDYVLVTQGTSLAMWYQSSATPSQYCFRETDGGAVHLQDVASGKYMHRTVPAAGGVVFELGDYAGALELIPKAVNGLLQLHYLHPSGNDYVGAAGTPAPQVLVVNSEPNVAWEAHPSNAPTDGVEVWRRTFNADNHFSPYVFLQHVKKVILHQDVEHTSEEYWQGLCAIVPGKSQTYAESIDAKINAWLNGTYEPGAPADAVMQAASTHFYTAASGEVNELDPKRPPDWPSLDDELGKDPYPG